MAVIKEMDAARMDDQVASMRKRLEKHCGTGEDEVWSFINNIWIE